jgi:CheY-like chemotaxis protein
MIGKQDSMKKILVAEDDKFLANAYRIKLEKEGYEISIARDGQEALDRLKSFKPDLILLDLIMPVKDGFTVLEEIRNNDAFKKIPIVITSNLEQKEDLDKVRSLGAVDYMVKSDTPIHKLVRKIKTILIS